jgi:antitoxin YefM
LTRPWPFRSEIRPCPSSQLSPPTRAAIFGPGLTRISGKRTLVRTYGKHPAMTTLTATEARKQLYKLLDDVSDSHEPIQITGKRGNAVLVGEDDWRAVQESLYLMSIPGMRESIIEGMATPPEELDGDLHW